MYQLMVSHNCGISYHPDRSAETVEALEPRMRELDAQGLRWGLDHDGVPVPQHHSLCHDCAIAEERKWHGW